MKRLIIDRFEGPYVVCEAEDKSIVTIPKYKLPLHCKEGDYLCVDPDGMYQKDTVAKKKREIRILEKMSRLFE